MLLVPLLEGLLLVMMMMMMMMMMVVVVLLSHGDVGWLYLLPVFYCLSLLDRLVPLLLSPGPPDTS